MATLNANPIVYQRSAPVSSSSKRLLALAAAAAADPTVLDEDAVEPWSSEEVFDLIRHINDPEHPLTLEQLNVAQLELVQVDDSESTIDISFSPTIPHCSMATLIGLCLRVKLIRSLPRRFKVSIRITPGTHASELEINKQLNDKERVAAALENAHLLEVVNKCVVGSDDAAGRPPPLAA